MMLHYSRARQEVKDGLVIAGTEMDRAREDAATMRRLWGDVGRLANRAHEIRERNGFDQIMTKIVEQGGSHKHGNGSGV